MQDRFTIPDWPLTARYPLRWAVSIVRGVAFWVAVIIPVAYLPILVTGLSTLAEVSILAHLFGINALALVLGHGHAETDESIPDR
jgi:hypothetical protein